MRIISGVVVVVMMIKFFFCLYGRCIYCLGGFLVGLLQSYIGKEFLVLRVVQSVYYLYIIMMCRLKQFIDIGYDVDKVEVIIQGGIFLVVDFDYQEWYVKCVFKVMNDFLYFKDIENFEEKFVRFIVKGDKFVFEEDFEFKRVWELIYRKFYYYFEDEQRKNEKVKVRMVGFIIEICFDWVFERQIDRMFKLGMIRVEFGVQMVFNFIYERIKRGYGVEEIIKVIQLFCDVGLKINYYIMFGLLGSNFERDLYIFRKIFEDFCFCLDMLKIYLIFVIVDVFFYVWYKVGKYRFYMMEEVVEFFVEVYKFFLKWVRVMRIQRDILVKFIVVGVKYLNFGQFVFNELIKRGIWLREICFREVGYMMQKFGVQFEVEYIKFFCEDYDVVGGREIFLSFEDVKNDILIGFICFRILSEKVYRKEINCCLFVIVRELYVYGLFVFIGGKLKYEWQYCGYGREFLVEVERIVCEEFEVKKMFVISGVGVREYYRKFGYRKNGLYVVKRFDKDYVEYKKSKEFDVYLNI